MRCWGDNGVGQLGYPGYSTLGGVDTPADTYDGFPPGLEADVDLGAAVRAIVAGDTHTCGLGFDGAVRCWGQGSSGQLGYGDDDDIGAEQTPHERYSQLPGGGVVPLFGDEPVVPVVQLTAGAAHTCALLENQTVRCWGNNSYGQLGSGKSGDIGDDADEHAVEVDIGSPLGVDEVVAGDWHTCVKLRVTADTPGEIRCWGRNSAGQLGYGDPAIQTIGLTETPAEFYAEHGLGPVQFQAPGEDYQVTHLAAGESHTCALLDPDEVRCWGNNNHGQLGYGTNELDGFGSTVGAQETPVAFYTQLDTALNQLTRGNVQLRQPNGAAGIERIAAGASRTCVVLSDNSVRCWGNNFVGRLGYGHDEHRVGDDETPLEYYLELGSNDFEVSVGIGDRVNAVSVARDHACALLTHGGRVRCWGEGDDGRLGYGSITRIGDTQLTPIEHYKQYFDGNGDVQVF